MPVPLAPTITMCRVNKNAGTASTGRQRVLIARMTGPAGTASPSLVASGSVPGAASAPRAAADWRRHWRMSKEAAANADPPAIPVVTAQQVPRPRRPAGREPGRDRPRHRQQHGLRDPGVL